MEHELVTYLLQQSDRTLVVAGLLFLLCSRVIWLAGLWISRAKH